ncbi:ABC transporter ATP-binding protein [Tsukamurella sp. 1534]|uniref:ABC transporter ATP-binding protein n=1 Tax=Tsukamurella sp. 1534 TaxID=1151061 RepID=UPI00031D6540|nr:ATP-binding cassette domain-containing protein [Tsukamurella sp. 1534]
MNTSHAPETGSAPAVSVTELTKRYGDRTAVGGVSFDVPVGSVTGLVGPNGAGKTTIMSMLLGLVRPTSGAARVLGAPVRRRGAYLPRVGALIETPAFHPAASARRNLEALAALGGHTASSVAGPLDDVGLSDRADEQVGAYSLGMKQRLGIAAALLGDPELVILDEPTNGLDPQGMQDVRALIRRIADGGDRPRTVIVSSHLLGELEHTCDHLVVLDRGGLVYLGPTDGLGAGDALVVRPASPSDVDDVRVIAGSAGHPTSAGDGGVTVTLDDPASAERLAAEINRRAHAAGITLVELHHRRASLEARYLDLVGASAAGE